MCERAIEVQVYINEWLTTEIARSRSATTNRAQLDNDYAEADYHDFTRLQISPEEWRHLEQVKALLKNFKTATTSLSTANRPLIAYIWQMYNKLFDFIDDMKKRMPGEKGWEKIVKEAAQKGGDKLSKYYSKTGDERGYLFNCATILNPWKKLTAYEVSIITCFYHVQAKYIIGRNVGA